MAASNLTAHRWGVKPRTDDVIAEEQATFASLVLSAPVLSGLTQAGFERPSPIQLNAIPLGRCGFDLIVQAKSGTGKTCVFAVVALESIDMESDATQVIVLSPTREIAVQNWEVICSIGRCLPKLQCYAFIGGLPLADDLLKLKKCHIAVATPGRLKQLVEQSALLTNNVRMFVLDEADKLMEDSFQQVVNWVYWSLPASKQVLALSATYPRSLARHLTTYMRDPMFVRLNTADLTLLGMREFHLLLPYQPLAHRAFEVKSSAIVRLLATVEFHQCLIFSNYQMRAQGLSDLLNARGWPCTYMSASQDQQHRLTAMARLRQFHCRVLVSTDLTSRGIDAENVNLVINIDVPTHHETYLHRIGRAGRFGTYGVAVTLVCEGAELAELKRIEQLCNTSIPPLPDPCPVDLVRSAGDYILRSLVHVERLNVAESLTDADVETTPHLTLPSSAVKEETSRCAAHMPGGQSSASTGLVVHRHSNSLVSNDEVQGKEEDVTFLRSFKTCIDDDGVPKAKPDSTVCGTVAVNDQKQPDDFGNQCGKIVLVEPEMSIFDSLRLLDEGSNRSRKYLSFDEVLVDYNGYLAAGDNNVDLEKVAVTEAPVIRSAQLSRVDWTNVEQMISYMNCEYAQNFPNCSRLLRDASWILEAPSVCSKDATCPGAQKQATMDAVVSQKIASYASECKTKSDVDKSSFSHAAEKSSKCGSELKYTRDELLEIRDLPNICDLSLEVKKRIDGFNLQKSAVERINPVEKFERSKSAKKAAALDRKLTVIPLQSPHSIVMQSHLVTASLCSANALQLGTASASLDDNLVASVQNNNNSDLRNDAPVKNKTVDRKFSKQADAGSTVCLPKDPHDNVTNEKPGARNPQQTYRLDICQRKDILGTCETTRDQMTSQSDTVRSTADKISIDTNLHQVFDKPSLPSTSNDLNREIPANSVPDYVAYIGDVDFRIDGASLKPTMTAGVDGEDDQSLGRDYIKKLSSARRGNSTDASDTDSTSSEESDSSGKACANSYDLTVKHGVPDDSILKSARQSGDAAKSAATKASKTSSSFKNTMANGISVEQNKSSKKSSNSGMPKKHATDSQPHCDSCQQDRQSNSPDSRYFARRSNYAHAEPCGLYANYCWSNYTLHMEWARYYGAMYTQAREENRLSEIYNQQMAYIRHMTKFYRKNS